MKKKHLYFVLLLFGFLMLESPTILLANKATPFVMGMPFLLFWVLLWWSFCTVVAFLAYRSNWGK